MTLYQYILNLGNLQEKEQAEVLWEMGVHLGERFDGEHKILLYQIEGFYVEVFYHQEQNKLVRLRSFRSVDQLRSYLERIHVSF
jgi:hypothetical protein